MAGGVSGLYAHDCKICATSRDGDIIYPEVCSALFSAADAHAHRHAVK